MWGAGVAFGAAARTSRNAFRRLSNVVAIFGRRERYKLAAQCASQPVPSTTAAKLLSISLRGDVRGERRSVLRSENDFMIASQARLAAAALAALLLVAVASRTAASESPQGAFATAQTRYAAGRLQTDAARLLKSSRQDSSVVVQLWNNADGQGLCLAAQHLLLRAGLPVPAALLDVASALQDDRDDLMERLEEKL